MIEFEKIKSQNGIVIAEVACGHNGSILQLKSLIDCVAESGASIIKFQIFKTEERAIKGHKEWDIFSNLELSEKNWEEGIMYARDKKLSIFADIFGTESLSLATKLNVDGYKIHSEDLLNTSLILDTCRTNKIVIIGVGGAKRIELYNLLEFLKNNSPQAKIIFMTGVQTFPTPLEAHSLAEIKDLISKYHKYGIKVGFSDHVSGELEEAQTIPLLALAAGADIIEKHITLNRQDKWIDYHSALNADEFKKLIQKVKQFAPLLAPITTMNNYEKSYRNMFKKSPTFLNTFSRGHLIEKQDIVYKKNSSDSVPISTINIIGKELSTDVQKDLLVRYNSLKNNIGAIIVARCGSSRLPHKALRKIQNKESIVLVIDRMKKCKNIGKIILATTNEPEDDKLVEIAKREGINYYRGPTDNVALRYYETALHYNLDHFIRMTGDAILCDEVMIDKAIIGHLYKSCDVTFMKNMPFGTSKEIVSVNALKTIIQTASSPDNTEYLEYYLENDRYFNINYISSNYTFNPNLRITLDYEEDLQFFDEIFKHFNSIKRPNFTLEEAIDWLNINENIVNINSSKIQKTPQNLNLDIQLTI